MRPSLTIWGSVCLLLFALASATAQAAELDGSVTVTPSSVARGETLTVSVTLQNSTATPFPGVSVSIPLPQGVDQWSAQAQVSGGGWIPYPANGLIPLSTVPANGSIIVDVRVHVEVASPATLLFAIQVLDATGVLLEMTNVTNVLPSVDAGPDLVVDLGMPCVLVNASARDGGGEITTLLWSDHASGGSFEDAAIVCARYVPPLSSGVFELTLMAVDADGGASSDSLRLRVNAPPDVEVGGDLHALEGETVSLPSPVLSDEDGWIAHQEWDDGGAGGVFSEEGQSGVWYRAPLVKGCEDREVVLTLTVTDDWGATASDSLRLLVMNQNLPPIVHVPDAQSVVSGDVVELTASASDLDGEIAEFSWQQVEGLEVLAELEGSGSTISLRVPEVLVPELLRFRFWAMDDCGGESSGETTVTVLPIPHVEDPKTESGRLSVRIDALDDRGAPRSSLDAPHDGDLVRVRVSVVNTGSLRVDNLEGELDSGETLAFLAQALDPWAQTSAESVWRLPIRDEPGFLEVVAVVHAIDSNGNTVAASGACAIESSASSDVLPLSLTVTPSTGLASPGDEVTFDYRITNTTDRDLEGLSLRDEGFGRIELPTSTLVRGESIEVSLPWSVRERDLPGPLEHRATVRGFTAEGDAVEAEASVSVDLTSVMGGGGGAATEPAPHIVLSEIAWAGTAADAAAEWIELANLGNEPVDLSGWEVAWYEKAPTTPPRETWCKIDLSGVIGPQVMADLPQAVLAFEATGEGLWTVSDVRWSAMRAAGYFLLERGSDDAVSNVPADLVYGAGGDPYYELPDVGAVVLLLDANGKTVDSANAQYPDQKGWPGGNLATHASMERIALTKGDHRENWQTSPGILTYGLDRLSHAICGTAGQPNAEPLEILVHRAEEAVAPLSSSTSMDIPILQEGVAERVSIRVTSAAGDGGAGGGAVSPPVLSTVRGENGTWLHVDLSHASFGRHDVWISLEAGRALLVPLRKTGG